MDNYEHTIKTWDKLAEKYQDVFMGLSLYDKSYDNFCQLLQKKDATILELGCGPGNITKYLFNKRPDYNIHAADAAPSMLALAEKNNPTATFELLDCRNIREIKNKFDAVVCGFCLPYLSETDGIKLIKDSYQLLHHDGLIYISIIEGDYSQSKLETSSDGQHSMFVHYFSEAFMTSTLEANHFSIVKIIRIAYARGNSEPSVHIVMIANKR